VSTLDAQRARVVASGGVAWGRLAGVLHELDGVVLDGRRRPKRVVHNAAIVGGVPCTDGLQTMIDLAAVVDDDVWEQALEAALRRRLVTIEELEAALPRLGAARTPGTTRIRRVLAVRPHAAAPTESSLETLMVQLARNVPGLGPPRQTTRRLEALALAAQAVGLRTGRGYGPDGDLAVGLQRDLLDAALVEHADPRDAV
jgi:hypothetical protein